MPFTVKELSVRWKFGDPFDKFVDASFILLPDWNSSRADIDITLHRLKFEYLPSLAIYTFVDLSTYSSPIRSNIADEEKCRQLHEISNLECQCDAHENNYPKYKFYNEVVEIVDRELSRVRRLFHIIRKIIQNEKVIGYTISLGMIKESIILKSIEDVEEFYALQLTALSMRKKNIPMYARMDELRRGKGRIETINISKGFGQTIWDYIDTANARIIKRRIESISSLTVSEKENCTPNQIQQKLSHSNCSIFIKESNMERWRSNERQSYEHIEPRFLPAPPLPIIHHPPVIIIPVFPVIKPIIAQNRLKENIQEEPNLDGWWKNPKRNHLKIKQPIVKQPETKQPKAKPPMDSFYLSPELQSFIINGQRILFGISTVLNCTAFICLLKETPENQSRFRNYLLYIQILAAINDINLDVLFEPFPLFPILGAFCNGIMCRLGVPIHYSFALSVFIVGNIGGSVLICFLYRHQSIVKDRSRLSKKTFNIIRFCIIFVYTLPGLVSFFVEFDGSQTEYLIDNFSRGDLSWIRQRGMYELFVKTREIMLIPTVTLTVLVLAYFLLIFMIQRIAASILGDTIRSVKTAKRNRRALIVLLIQLGVPILFLIVPSTIMMTSLVWETLLPFKFCLISFHVITFHTTVHSLVLLLITPAYRRFIRNFLTSLLWPKIFNGRIQPNGQYYRESVPVHVIDLSTVKAN